jgi:ABC-type polysaccharide/polyol phosphate transport system ATPase subunit
MASITLDNVNLIFRLRREGRISLKELLLHRKFRKSRNPIQEVPALTNINLRIGKGERVGIIGHNGAGKSTLLRLIAGIYPPTSGERRVVGQISSLFDIALGFEPTATGWENIRVRGYLQGETPRSIASKMPEIAEFCELGKFLDMPVRFYSSGMLVRLAFSIATAINPEVLLIDEVFGAGDIAFQQKAQARMEELLNRAQLLVFVGHGVDAIAKLCSRVIWMNHGQVHLDGPSQRVVDAFKAHMLPPSGQPSNLAA